MKKILIALTALLALGLIVPPTASAAVNYFNRTKQVTGNGVVTCPAGWKLTGGGYYGLPQNTYSSNASDEYYVYGSAPATDKANTWLVRAYRVHGSRSSVSNTWQYSRYPYTIKAVAVCVN